VSPSRIYLLGWAAFMFLSVGVGNSSAATSRPSETLLPDTTQGFFAISNVDNLDKHWNKSQLGQLMANPAMKPFTKDFRRQFDDRWANIHDRLGLTLDDLRSVAGGDVAIAMIAPAPLKAALAIVADCTGKLAQAHEVLDKTTKNQLRRGAKRSDLKVEGCPDVVIQFDLPELEEEKEAARSKLPVAEETNRGEGENGEGQEVPPARPAPEKPAPRQAFYCLTGNLLVTTDNLEIMKGILGRALGDRKDCLANCKPFRIVIDRCRKDYGDATPQMRWFMYPLGYAESARIWTPDYKRRKGKSVLEIMRNQGLSCVQGMGGFVDFSSEGYELVHRTAIHAPKPYVKSMKMAELPNKAEYAPQPWVPGDVATYTTFHFNVLNAFDNFGWLFDEMFGRGEEGVWLNDVLPGLEAPDGPQINLRKELIEHLGERVSILTDYQEPITTTSERLLLAVETKNPEAVAKALWKLFRNDTTVTPRKLQEIVVWEFTGEPTNEHGPKKPDPKIKIEFGDAPPVAPRHPLRRRKKTEDEDEEAPQPNLLPHKAVTVWQGHLIIASHIDFLRRVMAPQKKVGPLSEEPDYKAVSADIQKLDPTKCFRFFSHTDREYYTTYELTRKNKMPESESLFAKLLNGLFGDKKGGTRKQKVDGRKLPDYKEVRPYLGPAGLQATSETDGWFLKGFTMTR
jgi:hypothetical protein